MSDFATDVMADAINRCRRWNATVHPEHNTKLEQATRQMAEALFTLPLDDLQAAAWLERCGFQP